jgi:L-alanine-DL-glutamate epimerase-like enolase superfamily enzyme
MASENRRLRRIRWGVRVAPLNNPYELSFAQLTAFDVVWVWAEDEDGRIGIGEAVTLPGYNWETTDTVRATVARLCENTDGIAAAELVQRCREVRVDHPFAAAAVMTALDMPFFLKHIQAGLRFPISAPISGACPLANVRQAVDAQLAKG